MIVVAAAPAAASTWHVPGGVPTIAAALDAASAGDTVLVNPGIYAEYGLTLKSGVRLLGSTGDAAQVVLDGAGLDRLLAGTDLAPGTLVAHLSLANGYARQGAGGAASLTASSIVFRNCRFLDNRADSHGGALYLADCDTVVLEGCLFLANSSHADGKTGWGGAVALFSQDSGATLVMGGCRLEGNRSGGPGGAVGVENGSLHLSDCDLLGNRSGLTGWPAGAGVFARRFEAESGTGPRPDLDLVLEDCRIVANVGQLPDAEPYAGDGGGVMVRGHDAEHMYAVRVDRCRFEGNYNAQGGGLYVGRYSNGLIRWSTFYRNRAYLNGGGAFKGGKYLFSMGEEARFEHCLFQENDCGHDRGGNPAPLAGMGGAFSTRYYPRGIFLHCSFLNNLCGGTLERGDAIYHYSEGRAFSDTLQMCLLVNSVFYGETGRDVQVRGDPGGFSHVTRCAYETGEFVCDGIAPEDAVEIKDIPFISDKDPHLQTGSVCIDSGAMLGFGQDLDGAPVPQGSAPDLGALEHPNLSAAEPAPAASPPAMSAHPNPFNPLTTLEFTMARAGVATLEIFSLDGRRVRRLLADWRPAGPGRAVWDGRDDRGRPLPSAAYLARLRGSGTVAVCRLLLVK